MPCLQLKKNNPSLSRWPWTKHYYMSGLSSCFFFFFTYFASGRAYFDYYCFCQIIQKKTQKYIFYFFQIVFVTNSYKVYLKTNSK